MYQEEIDVLTKRCKSSDNTLLDLYKHMIELPDPSPFLSNAVNHIHSLEEQIQHLLKGMEEMQTEVVVKQQSKIQSLTNELEQSLRLIPQITIPRFLRCSTKMLSMHINVALVIIAR